MVLSVRLHLPAGIRNSNFAAASVPDIVRTKLVRMVKSVVKTNNRL
jgi:hypothetical protein